VGVVAAEGESRTFSKKLSWLVASENRRTAVIVLLWSLAIAASYVQALVQRAYMTLFDYTLVLVVCFVAGAIIMDVGKALLGYVAAIAIGTILMTVILIYPATSNTIPYPGNILIPSLWITVLFTAIFPFPFIGYLVAAVVGATVGERYI
jgi:hypothetical protein